MLCESNSSVIKSHIGMMLLSAQIVQQLPSGLSIPYMFSREFVKKETCEAQSETEGRIEYETRTYPDGSRISRLVNKPYSYSPTLMGFDRGSDGTFEVARSLNGEFVVELFNEETEKYLLDMKRKTLDRGKASSDLGYVNPLADVINGHKAHLTYLRDIALKNCRRM